MKKIIATILAVLTIMSMTACANTEPAATELPTVATENITKREFVEEFDKGVKEIFGDDLILTMYENDIYSIVITCEGIDKIYSYYHEIPDELSEYVENMSIAIFKEGLDNMMVVVSDVDNTKELLIIYNGIDVTKEVLNEN